MARFISPPAFRRLTASRANVSSVLIRALMAACVDHSWARARKRDNSSSEDVGEADEEVPSVWCVAAELTPALESDFSDDELAELDAGVDEETEAVDGVASDSRGRGALSVGGRSVEYNRCTALRLGETGRELVDRHILRLSRGGGRARRSMLPRGRWQVHLDARRAKQLVCDGHHHCDELTVRKCSTLLVHRASHLYHPIIST